MTYVATACVSDDLYSAATSSERVWTFNLLVGPPFVFCWLYKAFDRQVQPQCARRRLRLLCGARSMDTGFQFCSISRVCDACLPGLECDRCSNGVHGRFHSQRRQRHLAGSLEPLLKMLGTKQKETFTGKWSAKRRFCLGARKVSIHLLDLRLTYELSGLKDSVNTLQTACHHHAHRSSFW